MIALWVLGLMSSCTGQESEPTSEARDTMVVGVVNEPLACFAQRIGGEAVEVVFPVPPGIDPAYWSPDVTSIESLQRADLVLVNGAGYASWLSHVSVPLASLVDTSRGFEDRYLSMDDSLTHQHGPEGEHAHGEVAFTTWLDPRLAIEQAEAIRNAFSEQWPNRADSFQANFNSLQSELEAIDEEFARLTSGFSDRPILASHPVYQYFQRRYGLDLMSLHWEPELHPAPDAWAAFDELVSTHPATIMLWENEPRSETRLALNDRGIRCVVIKPGGEANESGDFLNVMQANLEALSRAVSEADQADD
jgi:zinc transport system substrate-binding protein